MKVSTVIWFSLLLGCISDVQAALGSAKLAKRVRQNEIEFSLWKRSAADIEAKMLQSFEELELTLKEELATTFVPSLIKSLVKKAMADILTEDFIGNITSGLVLDEVQSLKVNVQNTKTQLKALALQLRHVHQERDNYRKSIRKLRRRFTKNIRALQLQLNQTAASMCDARTTTYPGTTEVSAWTDSSPNNTAPPVTVTTQYSHPHASTTDESENLTPSKTVPSAPVTTQDSDAHATPSPARNRDFFTASRRGNLERVKRILAAGHVDINTRGGYFSRTPVMEAARNGHRDVVEFLVGRGADVSLVDEWGNNVLHLACQGGHLGTVELILSLNVLNINSRGQNRRTPVMLAAFRGHKDLVEFLVGKGANLSLVNRSGNNVLHWACRGGDVETVKLILSLNVVDVNARNKFGATAVYTARINGHQRVVDLLVSRGAH